MKHFNLTLLLITLFALPLWAQDATENVRLAFNAGSAKELVRYFSKITEVKINDLGGNYTIAQSEPVLREFFQQNPPTAFSYVHRGQSPQGLKYNIGQYQTNTKSYRVVILMKEVNGSYLVDTINFNEE